jgi:hypothetical protein
MWVLFLHHRHDLGSALHELIRRDEAHVPAAQHHDLFTRQHPVHVRQRLRRSRGDDPRQGGTNERGRILAASGGDDDLFCFDDVVFAVSDQAHALGEDAVGHRVKPHLRTHGVRLPAQLGGYVVSARARVVLRRAEELVYLLEKLSAWTAVLIHQHHLGPRSASLDGCAQSGGSGADDDDLSFQ